MSDKKLIGPFAEVVESVEITLKTPLPDAPTCVPGAVLDLFGGNSNSTVRLLAISDDRRTLTVEPV